MNKFILILLFIFLTGCANNLDKPIGSQSNKIINNKNLKNDSFQKIHLKSNILFEDDYNKKYNQTLNECNITNTNEVLQSFICGIESLTSPMTYCLNLFHSGSFEQDIKNITTPNSCLNLIKTKLNLNECVLDKALSFQSQKNNLIIMDFSLNQGKHFAKTFEKCLTEYGKKQFDIN